MLIDPEVRRQAREAQRKLEWLARRLGELSVTAGVSALSWPPAAALAATAAFGSVFAGSAAEVKQRTADDPPREDFHLATRGRPRHVDPESLIGFAVAQTIEEERAVRTVGEDLVWLGVAFARDDASEGAMLRAFERAAGAKLAGASSYVVPRVRDVERHRDRAVSTLNQLVELTRNLAVGFSQIATRDFAESVRRSGSLEELLPDPVLAALYRSGITITEVQRTSVEPATERPIVALQEVLRATSDTLLEYSHILERWSPSTDIDALQKAGASRVFEVYRDPDGNFRWRLTDEGTPIATSVEAFTSRGAALAAVQRVRTAMRTAQVSDLD